MPARRKPCGSPCAAVSATFPSGFDALKPASQTRASRSGASPRCTIRSCSAESFESAPSAAAGSLRPSFAIAYGRPASVRLARSARRPRKRPGRPIDKLEVERSAHEDGRRSEKQDLQGFVQEEGNCEPTAARARRLSSQQVRKSGGGCSPIQAVVRRIAARRKAPNLLLRRGAMGIGSAGLVVLPAPQQARDLIIAHLPCECGIHRPKLMDRLK